MDQPLTKYELDRATGVGLATLGVALAENAPFGLTAAHSDLIQLSLGATLEATSNRSHSTRCHSLHDASKRLDLISLYRNYYHSCKFEMDSYR